MKTIANTDFYMGVIKCMVVEQFKPQILPRPVTPSETAAFPKLQKVKTTLDKHNYLIFKAEREMERLIGRMPVNLIEA